MPSNGGGKAQSKDTTIKESGPPENHDQDYIVVNSNFSKFAKSIGGVTKDEETEEPQRGTR